MSKIRALVISLALSVSASISLLTALIVVLIRKPRTKALQSSSSSSTTLAKCETSCLPVSYNEAATPYYIRSPLASGYITVSNNSMIVNISQTTSPFDFVGSLSFDGKRAIYEIMTNLSSFLTTMDGLELINAVPNPVSSTESWNVYRLGSGMTSSGGIYSIVNLAYQKAITVNANGQISLTPYDERNPTLEQRLEIIPA